MLNYQEVIESSIGQFGRSQFIILIVTGLPQVIASWSMIMFGYAGIEPDWWLSNTSFNSSSNSTTIQLQYKICPKYENETIIFKKGIDTIVTEWNLICGKSWIVPTISTIQMVGVMVGAAVGGTLGDLIGRRKTLLIVFSMNLFFFMLEAFSINWVMMAVCVFFVGISLGGLMVLIKVAFLEFVGTEYRTIATVLPWWGLGVSLFGLLFKALPYWKHICYTTSATGIPIFILMWFYLPESVRWLFTQKRFDEGENALRILARRNKMPERDFSDIRKIVLEEESLKQRKVNYTYISLFRYRQTRWRAPLFGFLWFTCTFMYYAMTLGVGQLSGDLTVNMLLMGVAEMLQGIIVWVLAKCFGRKNSTLILMTLTSMFSFGITVTYFTRTTPARFKLIMSVLALISRLFLTAAWTSTIVFTAETFPTVVRTTVYGFASVFGRIGGIVAPQNTVLRKISPHLPFTVNGFLALTSGLLCLLLDDTYSVEMPDYLVDNERSYRYQIQEDIIVRGWLPPDFVENAIAYQTSSTDTFIVGYPRSGSSWISYIVYLLKNEGEPIQSSERLWEEIPEIGMGRHVAQRFGKYFVQLAEMVPHPRILRTHLPYDKAPIHPKAKCIYISRNPFDTAVSLFHEVRSINEFSGSFNDFFTYFLHGQTDYNDYFAHHKGWYERKFEQTVLWITYEDLMTYPRAIIKQIADYLGGVYQRSASDEFIMKKIINSSSFKEMREKESLLVQKNPNRVSEVSFFRKGQIRDFENFFNEEQIKKLREKFIAQFNGSKLLCSWERYRLPIDCT